MLQLDNNKWLHFTIFLFLYLYCKKLLDYRTSGLSYFRSSAEAQYSIIATVILQAALPNNFLNVKCGRVKDIKVCFDDV